MSAKKINPADYVVTDDTPISTIDLDREVFRLRDGHRLTEELAKELARQAREVIGRRNLIPGRKSLSGDGTHPLTHSPTIRVRVPEQLHRAATHRAA